MDSKDTEAGSNPDPSTSESGAQRYNLKWGLSLDMVYIKSLHGILTAAIIIISLIAFICVSAGRNNVYCDYHYGSAYNFFDFVSMSAFLTAIFNYVLYIFTFYDKIIFKLVPWALADLVWCGIFSVFYFIAALVVAVDHCNQPGNGAGAFFGFLALLAMGAKTYLAFQRVREERAEAIAKAGPQSNPEYPAGGVHEQY